jgi:predicted HTH domain antitoxin
MTEREAVIEIACRLFDIERLQLRPAAKLAGMSRAEFEQELEKRRIPIHRPTLQDIADDVATLEGLRSRS